MGGPDELSHGPDDDIYEDERGLDDLQRPQQRFVMIQLHLRNQILAEMDLSSRSSTNCNVYKKQWHSGSSTICDSIRNVRSPSHYLVVLLSLINAITHGFLRKRNACLVSSTIETSMRTKSSLKHCCELPDE
jgi:hypothetical protein